MKEKEVVTTHPVPDQNGYMHGNFVIRWKPDREDPPAFHFEIRKDIAIWTLIVVLLMPLALLLEAWMKK